MKRPWNLVESSIFSLVTKDSNGQYNYNICSYVMAISRQPKLYAIALQSNTLTCENMLQSKSAVLQHLNQTQAQWIRRLGKQSGRKYDKTKALQRNKALTNWKDFPVFKDCLSYVLLEKRDQRETGDHHLFTFEVKGYKTLKEAGGLTYSELVNKGYIL